MKTAIRSFTFLSAIATLALFSGCATTGATITSHADSAVNFSGYQTFAVARPSPFLVAPSPEVTPALVRQTRDEAQAAFAAKGLTLATHDTADLIVVVHGGVVDKLNIADAGYSYGRLGRGFAGRQELSQAREGKLLIDVMDAKTRELVWRGSAVAEIGETPSPEAIKSTVQTIVARYPN